MTKRERRKIRAMRRLIERCFEESLRAGDRLSDNLVTAGQTDRAGRTIVR
jgi:hypothetical protein